MRIPEEVSYIIGKLRESGEEAYAVGGCVRDTLLGRDPMDWDITTSARPEKVKELFRRTIDTGLQHGTVTIMIDDTGYEVTTYRVDGEYEDHRHPKEVVFTPNLEEDLKRRDFTINAMAYNEKTGIVDLFHGQEDLEAGVIRAVGIPSERFQEDALRMLRAIRFAGQLGFQIEEQTKGAMVELAPTLCHVSAERIQVEMKKLLVSKEPYLLATAKDVGLCNVFFPEFIQMMNTEQNNPHHCYCVGMHTLHAIEEVNLLSGKLDAKKRTILAFAALLHDVGKPFVKTTDAKGIDHFYDHEKNGSDLAKKILHRWKLDKIGRAHV